jgi:Tfp pilus assembly protein PilZ
MNDGTGKISSIKAQLVVDMFGVPKENIIHHSKIERMTMKFDYIVGNPPYQEKKAGNKKANSTLWQQIILSVAERATKSNTIMMMIHPAGWRKNGGLYKKTRELYNSWDMVFLSMNNMDTGRKVFGASTRFDWCVVVNRPYSGITEVSDEFGLKSLVDLRKFEIIPSDLSIDFGKWIGADEKCNFGYSASWYHCQRGHMSPVKTDEFKFPCVRNVGEDDKPTKFWYSNVNKGMFGVPKVIFGRFGYGIFIDRLGEYGCTEDCAFIAAEPEELDKIYETMKSEEFLKVVETIRVGGSRTVYETAFISQLRKDFWK